jgi:hypothetical protein
MKQTSDEMGKTRWYGVNKATNSFLLIFGGGENPGGCYLKQQRQIPSPKLDKVLFVCISISKFDA